MANDTSTTGAGPSVRRKLAAIFAADVAEFSRLIALDEEATLLRLADHRQSMDAIIAKHGGRIANTAGDSVLAEFESSVEAVRSAVEVQEALRSKNEGVPEDQALLFRIGINVGDVIAQGDDLLGDGVNVAARLEALAEPGGICLSSQVREQIDGKLTLEFVSMGKQRLKNIPKPVEAYKIAGGNGEMSRLISAAKLAGRKSVAATMLIVVLIGLAGLSVVYKYWQATETVATPISPVIGESYNQRDLDDWAVSSAATRKVLERASFEGHDYALVHAWGIKWMEAEAEARAMGGYLAAIGSQAENDFLVDLAVQQDDVWRKRDEGSRWQRFGPWIGFVQNDRAKEPDKGWGWSNGEPVVFTNWFPHQPDNYDGVEHYGRFRQFSDQPGIKWDDARAVSSARGYLVEFDGPHRND